MSAKTLAALAKRQKERIAERQKAAKAKVAPPVKSTAKKTG